MRGIYKASRKNQTTGEEQKDQWPNASYSHGFSGIDLCFRLQWSQSSFSAISSDAVVFSEIIFVDLPSCPGDHIPKSLLNLDLLIMHSSMLLNLTLDAFITIRNCTNG